MAWGRLLTILQYIHSYLSDQRIKWLFIIELSPWMGGFYQRLEGTSKRSLRKSIDRVTLASSQLQTILTKVEAVINTRPLEYGNNFLENQIITPVHFLPINIKTGTSVLTVNNDDEKADNEDINTAEKLL